MISLDTNVVSEVLKRDPDHAVLSWLAMAEETDQLVITAVTKAELLYGLARLPAGRRKQALAEDLRGVLDSYGEASILPFDTAAASAYGELVSQREDAGSPISIPDAQIAAICLTVGIPLATRNTDDFAGLHVALINPWAAG